MLQSASKINLSICYLTGFGFIFIIRKRTTLAATLRNKLANISTGSDAESINEQNHLDSRNDDYRIQFGQSGILPEEDTKSLILTPEPQHPYKHNFDYDRQYSTPVQQEDVLMAGFDIIQQQAKRLGQHFKPDKDASKGKISIEHSALCYTCVWYT